MSAPATAAAGAALLEVTGLRVEFNTRAGPVAAVRDLDFTVAPGEVLGLVGESGSGKTQAAMAVMGLLADNGRAGGSVRFAGTELLQQGIGQPAPGLAGIRGKRIAMVFQDPMTALNPYLTVAAQMGLVLRRHRGLGRSAARRECLALLEAVQVTDPERRLDQYPHQLSGGMRQRVMIATALSCRPDLLIADEPTTALDVTVQAQILELFRDLRARFGTAILFITHDLGVVAGLCERVLVMRDGARVEEGLVEQVFKAPRAEYTRQLLAAVPRLDRDPPPLPPAGPDTVLEVQDLAVGFAVPGRGWFRPPAVLKAVDRVSLALRAGETLGVVGESGSGKSTLARAVLGLVTPAGGRVCLLGRDLGMLDREALRRQRRDMQLVFQDPLAALDPRMTVGEILAEPLKALMPEMPPRERADRAARALADVGLPPEARGRYPHQFSGGQCQRIGIARALILDPKLVVCDEAVSALDVTVQAQVVELLTRLQRERGLALVFIAHDLAVVRRLSHRVLVLYLGRVMEEGPAEALYRAPAHPYTRALLAAVPVPDPAVERQRPRQVLAGEIPSPLAPPSGCRFRTRCPHVVEACVNQEPIPEPHGQGLVACHRAGQI